MQISSRPIEPPDIPGCLELLYNREAYPDPLLQRLPDTWSSLIRIGAGLGMVFLDMDAAPDGKIVAFGLSVVITDEFTDQIRQCDEPDVLIAAVNVLCKPSPPVLSQRAIGVASAQRGLNLLVLFFGFLQSDELFVRILSDKMIEGFNFTHVGYRWKEVLAIVSGEMMAQGFQAGGYRIRVMGAATHTNNSGNLLSPGSQNHLLGLRQDETGIGGDFTSRLAPVFKFRPPVFRFRNGERGLLLYALLGMNDKQIAERLCVSINTVKTRWRSIYDRVESCRTDFFPETGNDMAVRGPARRPALLRYVQDHLEELRPYDDSRP